MYRDIYYTEIYNNCKNQYLNKSLVGPLRFELKSQDPQPCRMDQATLRPRRVDCAFSMANLLAVFAIVNYCN